MYVDCGSVRKKVLPTLELYVTSKRRLEPITSFANQTKNHTTTTSAPISAKARQCTRKTNSYTDLYNYWLYSQIKAYAFLFQSLNFSFFVVLTSNLNKTILQELLYSLSVGTEILVFLFHNPCSAHACTNLHAHAPKTRTCYPTLCTLCAWRHHVKCSSCYNCCVVVVVGYNYHEWNGGRCGRCGRATASSSRYDALGILCLNSEPIKSLSRTTEHKQQH